MKKNYWIIVLAVAIGVGGGTLMGDVFRGESTDLKHLMINVGMISVFTLVMLFLTRKPEPKEENSSGKEIKRKKHKKKR